MYVVRRCAQLGALRLRLLQALESGDAAAVDAVAEEAAPHIAALEAAMLDSGLLQTYSYNPDKGEANPAFSVQEEVFARGGLFERL